MKNRYVGELEIYIVTLPSLLHRSIMHLSTTEELGTPKA